MTHMQKYAEQSRKIEVVEKVCLCNSYFLTRDNKLIKLFI